MKSNFQFFYHFRMDSSSAHQVTAFKSTSGVMVKGTAMI